jgi:hypothetical protein
MKRLENILFLLISISTLTILTSCGAIVKGKANKNLTEEKGAIPPEFGSEKTTILFITHKRSYNKYLKKNVRKIYKGDSEIISTEELNSNTKYDNIEKYRYIFDYDYKSYTYTRSDLSSGSGQVKTFYILDRKNGTKYFSPMTSSYWSKLQKIYLKKLNEKLNIN